MPGTNLGQAYVQIMPSAKGIGANLSKELDSEMNTAGAAAGGKFSSGLGGTLLKGLAALGIGAAVKKLFSEAINAGAEMQQSFGGLDTIYGDASGELKNFAYQASQAGISANDYAEQAVSLGAALRKAYEYDSQSPAEAQLMAARQADKVIMDMQDNAAKMGTDIGSIQNAYQGFAKQNYTMLDNLKLGYGGTKEEMQRLLEDATKLSGIEYNINNLSDVTDAIHVMQQELGLTGVAAQEGAETFSGSMAAMKASATNLLANMALGESIKQPLSDLVTNTKNFLVGNLFPMIGNIVKQIPGLLASGLKWAFANIPGMIDSIITFINNLTTGMTNNAGKFKDALVSIGKSALEMFKNIDWKGLGLAVVTLIGTALKIFGSFIWDALKAIGATAAEWFKNIDWAEVGKTVINTILTGLKELGSLIWEGLKAIGQTAWEWFSNIDWGALGSSIINGIINTFANLGSLIWEGLKSIGQTAWEWFSGIDWAGLGNGIINGITNAFTNFGSWIWNGLYNIGTTAWSWFSGIDWGGLGNSIINGIITAFTNFGSLVWEGLRTIGTTAWEWFDGISWGGLGSNIINGIINGISDILANLWETLTTLANNIWDKLGNIDWKNIGTNIIYGLVNGIAEQGHLIWDTLHAWAESAWNNVKNFFGISSPSKLMEDTIGKWIPIGMAEGIESEGSAVVDAMNSIAEDAATTIDTDLGYNATASALGNGVAASPDNIAINIYPTPGMNVRELADEVQRRLAMVQRQKQAVWGTA